MHSLRSVLQLSFVLLAAIQWSVPTSGQDDLSSEPFSVYVAQEGAFARCGPSGEYYRTDPLAHGQALQVYAETDDGWLGIRPPEDSFCWVVAEAVELAAGGEHGTVIEDRTVAWIGTHLGRARKYRWQVQLAKGEPVSVIGRSEREGASGPQLWYRIVPPSGEFRWVHRDQVVSSSQELVASIDPTAEGDIEFLPGEPTRPATKKDSLAATPQKEKTSDKTPTRSRPNARSQAQLESQTTAIGSGLSETWQSNGTRGAVEDSVAAIEPAAPSTLKEAVTQGGLLASVEFLGRPRLSDIGAAAPSGMETAGDENWVAGMSRSLARAGAAMAGTPTTVQEPGRNPIQQVAAFEPINVGRPLAASPAPVLRTLNVVSAEQIAEVEAQTQGADVDRLSLILSRLMASRASALETEPVVRAAKQLASSSADEVMLGRARLLAERAEQYQRVAGRRDGEAIMQSSAGLSIPSSQPMPTQQNSPSTVVQTGFLVQVYSARTNSPPFALTDHSGRTIAYVTPTPGVNIRSHLNSHIRVTGQQGFLRGLNTPHILATQAFRTPE